MEGSFRIFFRRKSNEPSDKYDVQMISSMEFYRMNDLNQWSFISDLAETTGGQGAPSEPTALAKIWYIPSIVMEFGISLRMMVFCSGFTYAFTALPSLETVKY